MYDQLKDYFDKTLSKYQCGFRKGFNILHCLPAMIEKLQNSLDSGWREGGGVFNIFLCNLFLFLHDIPVANYADDNTPYCTGLKISDVLIKLENTAETLLQWFKDNRMKVNPDKYHLFINNTKESSK